MGPKRRRLGASLLAAQLLASCATPERPLGHASPTPHPTGITSSVTPSTVPGASPLVVSPLGPGPGSSPTPAALFSGTVLGIDGKPAVGVTVRTFLIPDSGGAVIANNGGGLISDAGSGLTSKTKLHLLDATSATITTDTAGHFTLPTLAGPSNVEAVASDTLKAIQLGVANGATHLTLQLAPTGTIAGRVTAPNSPKLTNFEGTDVFIPGTSYVAKADARGQYTLDHVAIGSFTLVASKPAVGGARVSGVAVASNKSTSAPDLALATVTPVITGISPPAGVPGTLVTITGTDFGASAGGALEVSFGGAVAPGATRVDDHTITVTVPPAAASGDVVVVVAGAPSAGKPFTLPKSLSLAANVHSLLVGDVQAFTAAVLDEAGHAVAGAPITWTSDGDAVTIDAQGRATARHAGKAVLHAALGGANDTLAVTVSTELAKVSTLAGGPSAGHNDGAGLDARFESPSGLALDGHGYLYVADSGAHRIRRIDTTDPLAPVTTIAGSGSAAFADGPGNTASFNLPSALALDAHGDLWVADTGNHRIRKITLGDASHPVVTIAGTDSATDADGPGASASFASPTALAFDLDGTLLVGDATVLRRLDPVAATHPVSTFKTSAQLQALVASDTLCCLGNIAGLAVTPNGTVHASFQDLATPVRGMLVAFPVTAAALVEAGSVARPLDGLSMPGGIAQGPAGDLFITSSSFNTIIHFASGACDVVAGPPDQAATETYLPGGWVDGAGPEVRFNQPSGLARAPSGDLYIADTGNFRVRHLVNRKAP